MDFKKIVKIVNELDDDNWDEKKEKWKNDIEDLYVPEDIQGQLIIKTEHELDILFTKASYYHTRFKTLYEGIEEYVEAVRKAMGDKGSNPEERRANAYNILLNYPTGDSNDDKAYDLIEIKNRLRDRHYFFRDYVIKNLKVKSDRLRNQIGASKIDAQISSSYGSAG